MRDEAIAQLNCIAERLHGQRAFGDAGKIEEIRYRPEREHEMVVFECMGVSIKAADLIQKVRFWLGEGLYYRSQLYVIDLEKMLLAEELPNDLLQKFRATQKERRLTLDGVRKGTNRWTRAAKYRIRREPCYCVARAERFD